MSCYLKFRNSIYCFQWSVYLSPVEILNNVQTKNVSTKTDKRQSLDCSPFVDWDLAIFLSLCNSFFATLSFLAEPLFSNWSSLGSAMKHQEHVTRSKEPFSLYSTTLLENIDPRNSCYTVEIIPQKYRYTKNDWWVYD